MKILFAAPDRDLLECYKKILEEDIGETLTAFDGTQVMTLLASGSFDILILDRDIPRVDYKTLLERAESRGIPTVVMTDEPVGSGLLTSEPLPCAWLPHPFTHSALEKAVLDVLATAATEEMAVTGDVRINPKEFRIEGGPRLTLDEINALKALASPGTAATENPACVASLNVKLGRAGSKTRIRYAAGKGFEMVTADE